jgi:hypothetical protein
MTVNDLLESLNTAALVVGYLVLIMFVTAFLWMLCMISENRRHNLRRRRRREQAVDNARSRWLDTYIPIERQNTVEHPIVNMCQGDTDVFPEITPEAIINYQTKEQYRDGS